MSISVDTTGAESLLMIEIDWGNLGSISRYSDKVIATPVVADGRILQANVVSKTGQIGQSGVSKTTSVTLDDTDGAMKTIYDSKVIEGSLCNVYQIIYNATGNVQQFLMSGKINSDIKWSEGERTLSFSIEGGTNRSGESDNLGYAPKSGDVANLNDNAVGKNWPIVFGAAHKVPAVEIIYRDNITLDANYGYVDSSYEFVNGDQLPQTPTVIIVDIDSILFEGTQSGTTFTPTTKNKPRYAAVAFAARGSGDDGANPSIAWVPAGVSLEHMYVWVHLDVYRDQVNYCYRQEGDMCYFAQPWWDTFLLTPSQQIEEAARWARTSWPVDMIYYYDGGNVATVIGKDKWTIYKGDQVNYESGTDYDARYVANLYPSTSILAIYGKRAWKGKTIWAKIPMSYYHYHLNEAIVTGLVTRYCTVIDFPKKLDQYECEGWTNDIWVSLVSTLPNTPKTIFNWITTNFTSFTFDGVASDDPPVGMDFAYFQTTDAIEFLKGIAYQSASAMQISGIYIWLTFLGQVPGTSSSNVLHTFTDSLILMKTVELGFKAIEEINTRHKSTYVIDYSGEPTASKVYEIDLNVAKYGTQVAETDMWALTCDLAVKAVTDFWKTKTGNSWKTIKCECFLDISDANVFDGGKFQISPFLPTDTKGLITEVVHDTDRPNVIITVEMAVPAGTGTEDPNYWLLGPAICIIPSDSEVDYVPPKDPSCPVTNGVGQVGTPIKKWHIAIVKCPAKIWRWTPFSVDLAVHDHEHNDVDINIIDCRLKLYSDSPRDFYFKGTFNITAGKATINFPGIKRSMIGRSRIHLWVNPDYSRIFGGNIQIERPKHL